MHTYRTRFKNEIIAEFLPPIKITKKIKVIIFLDGAPSVPKRSDQLIWFAKKGFWVFHPRYRGSWESSGKFLQYSLEKDVVDIIDCFPRGFKDLWNNQTYQINPHKIFLIGGSFGGPAALLATKDQRVDKVIAISPVIDWRKLGKAEPLDELEKYFREGFGNGYRVAKNGWQKLTSGKFYNPINRSDEIDSNKILLIHAKDDTVCPYHGAKKFAKKKNIKLITIAKGGHLGSSILMKPRYYKILQKFLKS